MLNSAILLKKYLVTTNYIDATGRPVILAAAGLPVRALCNENVEEIIDSLERIPNTKKDMCFAFHLCQTELNCLGNYSRVHCLKLSPKLTKY